MTETDNLMDMFGEVADPYPQTDAPLSGRGLAFAEERLPEGELPTLTRVLRLLPVEARAEAFEIAQALQIREDGDELLYSILVGLGVHKTLLAGVPDKIVLAGEQSVSDFSQATSDAVNNISHAITESASALLTSTNLAKTEIQQVIKTVGNQIQISAAKGAQSAVSNFDISPIAEKIAARTETGLARAWFSRAIVIASLSAVVLTLSSGFAGYKIGASGSTNNNSSSYYLNQLQCGAANNAVIFCRDQFGNIAKFKEYK